MDDTLLNVSERVNTNSELFSVMSKCFNLSSAGRISYWLIDIQGWSVVVFGSDC